MIFLFFFKVPCNAYTGFLLPSKLTVKGAPTCVLQKKESSKKRKEELLSKKSKEKKVVDFVTCVFVLLFLLQIHFSLMFSY
jgi:hypothetical protein